MKKNFLNLFVLGLVLSALLISCGESKFKGFKQSETGLYYKYHIKGDDTLKPVVGDLVTLSMIYGMKDSVLFDSKRIPRPLTFPMEAPQFKGDVYEGLSMLTEGDSVTFMISVDSFFLITARAPQLPPFIDSGSFMFFHIKLIDIETLEEKNKKEEEMLQQRKEEETIQLQKYIEENDIKIEPTASGLYFIPEKNGFGPNPIKGQMVSIHMEKTLLDGKKIFSTHDRGEPIEFEYGKKFDTEGLEEALGMMKKGGKARLIMPSKLAYGAEKRGQFVDSYSTLLYNVELVNIRSMEAYKREQENIRKKKEAEEQKQKVMETTSIEKWLKDNNYNVAPRASGLYFIELEEGTGIQPVVGNKVQVHYTGKLLDGKKFDSSVDRGEPFTFTLGQGQVIKGWDEGIALMKEGEKSLLVIPSHLGYGKQGAGADIPPNTPLVFEVELLKVE